MSENLFCFKEIGQKPVLIQTQNSQNLKVSLYHYQLVVGGWADSAAGRTVILADRSNPPGNVRLTPLFRKTEQRGDEKRHWDGNTLFLLVGCGE
jgi:hypothetical protein